MPTPQNTDIPQGARRRRWVKVDVEESVFIRLHMNAAESRMRIQPYLRRWLAEARPLTPVEGPSFAAEPPGIASETAPEPG